MKDKVKSFIEYEYFDYVAIGIISALAFIMIYGIKILNPGYTDWLLAGEDLTQHYLGWRGYRAGSFGLQIGMTEMLAYPNKTSVIFTDSIPLFAVIFKLFSFILPSKFQYFGLWGIMCFILQGVFACRILRNFSKNKLTTVLLSAMFLLMPAMLRRMYVHTALAAHWIILFGLEPLFVHKKYDNNKKIYIIAALMGFFASTIHLYFIPLCGIIIVGLCIEDMLINRRVVRSAGLLLSYLGSVVATVFILGGLSTGMQHGESGLFCYTFNLNSFVNPQGWSVFFKDLPVISDAQYEGLAYLGAGIFFLAIVTIIIIAVNQEARTNLAENYKVLISLAAVLVISIIVACSPSISLNDKVILEVKLPDTLINLWSIFRSTGRMIWDALYVIILCLCIMACRFLNKKTLIIVAAIALLMQTYDQHAMLREIREQYKETKVFESGLPTDDFWKAIAADEEIKHIVLYSGDGMNSLTDWALDHNISTNRFYFARSIDDLEDQCTQDALNNLSDDSIYIFKQKYKNLCPEYDLHYYLAYGLPEIDGVIVGTTKEIKGFEELSDSFFEEE